MRGEGKELFSIVLGREADVTDVSRHVADVHVQERPGKETERTGQSAEVSFHPSRLDRGLESDASLVLARW